MLHLYNFFSWRYIYCLLCLCCFYNIEYNYNNDNNEHKEASSGCVKLEDTTENLKTHVGSVCFLYMLSSKTVVNRDRTERDRTKFSPVDKCGDATSQRSICSGVVNQLWGVLRDKLQKGTHTRGSQLTQLYIVI